MGGQWHPAGGTVPSLHLPQVQAASISPHGGGLMDRPSRSARCRGRVRTEKLICQAQRLRGGWGWGVGETGGSETSEAPGSKGTATVSHCAPRALGGLISWGGSLGVSRALARSVLSASPAGAGPKGQGPSALLACWTRSLCHGGRPVPCGVFRSTPASTLWTPAAPPHHADRKRLQTLSMSSRCTIALLESRWPRRGEHVSLSHEEGSPMAALGLRSHTGHARRSQQRPHTRAAAAEKAIKFDAHPRLPGHRGNRLLLFP